MAKPGSVIGWTLDETRARLDKYPPRYAKVVAHHSRSPTDARTRLRAMFARDRRGTMMARASRRSSDDRRRHARPMIDLPFTGRWAGPVRAKAMTCSRTRLDESITHRDHPSTGAGSDDWRSKCSRLRGGWPISTQVRARCSADDAAFRGLYSKREFGLRLAPRPSLQKPSAEADAQICSTRSSICADDFDRASAWHLVGPQKVAWAERLPGTPLITMARDNTLQDEGRRACDDRVGLGRRGRCGGISCTTKNAARSLAPPRFYRRRADQRRRLVAFSNHSARTPLAALPPGAVAALSLIDEQPATTLGVKMRQKPMRQEPPAATAARPRLGCSRREIGMPRNWGSVPCRVRTPRSPTLPRSVRSCRARVVGTGAHMVDLL